MESEKLKDLLHKYYEGETNIEEERLLKSEFKNTDIPDNPDGSFFNYLNNYQKTMPEPDDLESSIMKNITEIHGKRLYWKKNTNTVIYGLAAGIMLIFVIRGLNLDKSISPSDMTASINADSCVEISKCKDTFLEMLSFINSNTSDPANIKTFPDSKSLSYAIVTIIDKYNYNGKNNILIVKGESLKSLKNNLSDISDSLPGFYSDINQVFVIRLFDNNKIISRNDFFQELAKLINSNSYESISNTFSGIYSTADNESNKFVVIKNYSDHSLIWIVDGKLDLSSDKDIR